MTNEAENTKAAAPNRETYKQLSVNIRLADDVEITQALKAVEDLGEVQSISVYQQYGPALAGPDFY